MGKGNEVKEDERASIVGMAKGGATISKIVEETTILQDDNAPVYRASVVTSWKNNHFLEPL